jgi:hypothetical protein
MRWFLSRRIPPFTKVLLVESGSRHITEHLLSHLRAIHPDMQADLFTCFSGAPANFDETSNRIYRSQDYATRPARTRFLGELARNGYNILGIICSGEPVLTRWKWILAARLPAKVFILNENGDYFWLDRGHLSTLRAFLAYRAGLSDAGAVRTLAGIALLPFTFTYLLLYAGCVHMRRLLRNP